MNGNKDKRLKFTSFLSLKSIELTTYKKAFILMIRFLWWVLSIISFSSTFKICSVLLRSANNRTTSRPVNLITPLVITERVDNTRNKLELGYENALQECAQKWAKYDSVGHQSIEAKVTEVISNWIWLHKTKNLNHRGLTTNVSWRMAVTFRF